MTDCLTKFPVVNLEALDESKEGREEAKNEYSGDENNDAAFELTGEDETSSPAARAASRDVSKAYKTYVVSQSRVS